MAAVTRIHSGAEEDAITKGKVEEHADLVLAREVTRPSPKPPNPDSHTMALGEASTSTSTNRSERRTANNGAEGGAFAEGKRMAATMEDRVTRLETVSRKTVTNGSPRARQLRRFILLTPPPLLAAVFPWNRGGDAAGRAFVRRQRKRHRERRRPATEKEGRQRDGGETHVGGCWIFGGCHGGDPRQRTPSFLLRNGGAMETVDDEAVRRETITHRGSGCSGHGRRRSNPGCLCAWNLLGARRHEDG
ncbi:hypothetical protein PIB30_014175 [Stylosanthes scabra]|uniref:Uncharacterized protein n=1 Tax=Stylosanthes scabra TaxID=79078 RepID=A0ABU6V898_9FABA|nr:hypothetical protein [Stylosanthes scabra]